MYRVILHSNNEVAVDAIVFETLQEAKARAVSLAQGRLEENTTITIVIEVVNLESKVSRFAVVKPETFKRLRWEILD